MKRTIPTELETTSVEIPNPNDQIPRGGGKRSRFLGFSDLELWNYLGFGFWDLGF
jgi:hypothetical protein